VAIHRATALRSGAAGRGAAEMASIVRDKLVSSIRTPS
jgi:hypothetical protein